MKLLDIHDPTALAAHYRGSSWDEGDSHELRLGEVLFSWRMCQLITQGQAAKKIGVHRTTYAAWEAGQVEFRVASFKRLLAAGFTADQLGIPDYQGATIAP